MISDFFLVNAYVWLWAVLGFLPNGPAVPTDIATAINYLFSAAYAWNEFFPITQIFILLSISLTIEFAILNWNIFWTIYSKIPLIGKK